MRRFLLSLTFALGACTPSPAPTDAGTDAPVAEPDAPAPVVDAPAGDTWSTYAMGFFATYCVECHAGSPSGRDFRTITDVVRDAPIIRCGVAPASAPSAGCGAGDPSPEMFPIGDGPFPSEAERLRLLAWLEAGLPE